MMLSAWQHNGNEKSNSPYLMDNTDNVNPTSDNSKAKLFKLCFREQNTLKLDGQPVEGKVISLFDGKNML